MKVTSRFMKLGKGNWCIDFLSLTVIVWGSKAWHKSEKNYQVFLLKKKFFLKLHSISAYVWEGQGLIWLFNPGLTYQKVD